MITLTPEFAVRHTSASSAASSKRTARCASVSFARDSVSPVLRIASVMALRYACESSYVCGFCSVFMYAAINGPQSNLAARLALEAPPSPAGTSAAKLFIAIVTATGRDMPRM